MFQILAFQMIPYFAFGQQSKSSLIAQFCRQNKYQHIKNPIVQALQNQLTNHAIIEGSIQLFNQLEPIKPDLEVIFIGNKFSEQQIKIRREYRKIGKCIQVREINYEKFRKAMFPNLVFLYGPEEEQILKVADQVANLIGYCRVALPPNANSFIKEFNKTVNYVINGLFTSKQQISILQQYFNIKIIHFTYNRIDLPSKSQYFDKQFQLLSYLKSKQYYISVNGLNNNTWQLISQINKSLCPQLIYSVLDTPQKRQYLNQYLYRNQQTTLILSIYEIMSITKRKNINLTQDVGKKNSYFLSVIYRDFNIRRIIILDYPHTLDDVMNFQHLNRKFTKFVDLLSPDSVLFNKHFTTEMYFLTNQQRVVPNLSKPLEDYINPKTKYWLINGSAGCGKTTVAKLIAANYGAKLIEYQSYLASVKQKIISPEDGEQLPFKKILAHFKSLMTQNSQQVYVIDGLPFDNKELEQWVKQIGVPSVINIQVTEQQSIKRLRKKNEADVNAEVGQQQANKMKQSFAKAQKWLQKVRGLASVVQVHQVNFGGPLVIAQKQIHKIFVKNVYLVQTNSTLIFQNIALKYNLGFINLLRGPLRDIKPLVASISNKDIILCYYQQIEEKFVSQDLYWIERNVGKIRYLAIWQPEVKDINEEYIQLQRPQVAEKPKVQGAQGQQKPVEQQNVPKPASDDIYSYKWSKPVNSKNLSQWFLKWRQRVTNVQSQSGKQLFQNWQSITSTISQSDQGAVYQTFK